MRRLAVLLAAAALGLGACSSDDEDSEVPVACLAPPAEYLRALERAPGEVRLEGATPISDCVVVDQDPGSLAQLGETTVLVATRLNAEARRDPSSPATVQLGYLVGALQEGASGTGGIHEDLVRRLDAAARFTPDGKPPPLAFERAFGRGYAAGQAGG